MCKNYLDLFYEVPCTVVDDMNDYVLNGNICIEKFTFGCITMFHLNLLNMIFMLYFRNSEYVICVV